MRSGRDAFSSSARPGDGAGFLRPILSVLPSSRYGGRLSSWEPRPADWGGWRGEWNTTRRRLPVGSSSPDGSHFGHCELSPPTGELGSWPATGWDTRRSSRPTILAPMTEDLATQKPGLADAGVVCRAMNCGYLSPGEVAAYLNVSLHAVRAWRKRGRFPAAYRFGKLLRWRRVDIEAWATTRRERGGGAGPNLVKSVRQSFHEGRHG